MRRTRSATVLLGVLVAASAAAFLRAEQLKLERSPVAAPAIPKHFSATCKAGARTCTASHRATFRFVLRRADTVSLAIVDGSGHVIRSLSGPEHRAKGPVTATWDGRTAGGALAPDGKYHLRIDVRSLGHAITVPNPIGLDDTPPIITLESRSGALPHYRLSEHARVYAVATPAIYQGPPPEPRSVVRCHHGEIRLHPTQRVPAGTKVDVVLVAVDPAGNSSQVVSVGTVRMPS